MKIDRLKIKGGINLNIYFVLSAFAKHFMSFRSVAFSFVDFKWQSIVN